MFLQRRLSQTHKIKQLSLIVDPDIAAQYLPVTRCQGNLQNAQSINPINTTFFAFHTPL